MNFRNGDPAKWVGRDGTDRGQRRGLAVLRARHRRSQLRQGGTIFQGSNSVWRTQDWAGDQTFLETNCPEFTTSASNPLCGDFVQIGPPGRLPAWLRTWRLPWILALGGNVAAIARTPSDTATCGPQPPSGAFSSPENADAGAGLVTYLRFDSLPSATASPGRFISGIYVDPANPNHAWISSSSYSSLTPATPGHVFSVTYDPIANDATWTSLDGSGGTAFPDFPATGIARDSNGDVYASNDWGVLRLPNGSTDWGVAGSGLPMVEVTGLVIVPSAELLYASTHGRSAWVLNLP